MRQNTYAVKISYNTVKNDGDKVDLLVTCCNNQFIAENYVVDKIKDELQATGDLMQDYETEVYEYARG